MPSRLSLQPSNRAIASGVRILAAAAATLVALPSSAPGSETILGVGLHAVGARELRAGNSREGIRLSELALATEPLTERETAGVLSNICAGYVQLEIYSAAIDQCSRAATHDARNWRIYNNRAAAYLGKGMIDEAISDFRHALTLHPTSHMLLQSLGVALERKRRGDSQPRVDEQVV